MTRTILVKCVCLILLLLVDVDWVYAARNKTRGAHKKRGHHHRSKSHDIHTIHTHDSFNNTHEVHINTSTTVVVPNQQNGKDHIIFTMPDDKLLNNISSGTDADQASLPPKLLEAIFNKTHMKPGNPNLTIKFLKLPPSVTTTHHINATHHIINTTTVEFHDVPHPLLNLTPVGTQPASHTVRKISTSSTKIINNNLPAKPPKIVSRSDYVQSTVPSTVKPIDPNLNSKKQQKIGQPQVEPTVTEQPAVEHLTTTQRPNQILPKSSQVKTPLQSPLSHSPERIGSSKSAQEIAQHPSTTPKRNLTPAPQHLPRTSSPFLGSTEQPLRSHLGLSPRPSNRSGPSGPSLNSSVSTSQKSGSPRSKKISSGAIGSKNSVPISKGSLKISANPIQNNPSTLSKSSLSLSKPPGPQHDLNGGTLNWKSHIIKFTNSEMCLRYPDQCKRFTNMLETFSAYDGSTDPKTGKVSDILSGKSTFGSFATEQGNTRGILGTEDFTQTFNNMNDHITGYPPIDYSQIRPDHYGFGSQHAPQVLTSQLDSINRHFRNFMSNTPQKTSSRNRKFWNEGQKVFGLDKYKTDSHAQWPKHGHSNNYPVFSQRQFHNPKYVHTFSKYHRSPAYYQLHEGQHPKSSYIQQDEETPNIKNYFKSRSVAGYQFPLHSGLHHKYNNVNPSYLGQNKINEFTSSLNSDHYYPLIYKHISNPFLKTHLPTQGKHFFTPSDEHQKKCDSLLEYRPLEKFQHKQAKNPHIAHEISSYSASSYYNEFNPEKPYASYHTSHHNINHEPHFEERKIHSHRALLPSLPFYAKYDSYARLYPKNNRRHREFS